MNRAFPAALALRADLILAYGFALWAIIIALLGSVAVAGLRTLWRTLGPGQPAVPRHGGLTPGQARAWRRIERRLTAEMDGTLAGIKDEMERKDDSP